MGFLLDHILRESASRSPEKTAVIARGRSLTYGELESKSNQLAHFFWEHGIRKGDRVGIHLDKSVESIVTIFGALKTGAIYVPLDPQAPVERAARIADDCQIKGLISTSARMEALKSKGGGSIQLGLVVGTEGEKANGPECIGWHHLSHFPASRPPEAGRISTDLAYILYTSGSTGRPKGVMISHLNALTFVDWAADTFQIQPGDHVSNHAPLHFDLSVFDIFNGLKAGATIFMIPEEVVIFPASFASFLEEKKISVLYCVPSALIHLLLHGGVAKRDLRGLRLILFAGEVFPTKYVRQLKSALPGADLFNLYGPTETNVCTYCKVGPELLETDEILPIGKGCDGTSVFVVSENGQLASIPGDSGELYVRGPSVTYGYWGDPEKTRGVLVRNEFELKFEEKAYRTGDFVRLRSDGGFDFLGRRDNMVKSRGHRIELGEIEAGLHAHPKVQEAAAMAIPDEQIGSRIAAVVAPLHGQNLTAAELQQHCASLMPKYMIPEVIEVRESLPRTSTGKLDRMRLATEIMTPVP